MNNNDETVYDFKSERIISDNCLRFLIRKYTSSENFIVSIARNSDISQKQSAWFSRITQKTKQKLNQLNNDLNNNTKIRTENISISVKFLHQINEICKNLPLGEYLEYDNYFCELQICDRKCEFSCVYYDESNLPNQFMEAIQKLKNILSQNAYAKLFFKIPEVLLHPSHFVTFKNNLLKLLKRKKLDFKEEITAESESRFSVIVSTKNDDDADKIINQYILDSTGKMELAQIGPFALTKFSRIEQLQNAIRNQEGIFLVLPKMEHDNCILQCIHRPSFSKIEILKTDISNHNCDFRILIEPLGQKNVQINRYLSIDSTIRDIFFAPTEIFVNGGFDKQLFKQQLESILNIANARDRDIAIPLFSEFFAQEINNNVDTNIQVFFATLWDCLMTLRQKSKILRSIQFIDSNEFICKKFIAYLNTKAITHDLEKEERPVYVYMPRGATTPNRTRVIKKINEKVK